MDLDKGSCVDLCKETDGCTYYSYDNVGGFCSAYESCPLVDDSCNSCVSGEADCPRNLCQLEGGCVGILVTLSHFNTSKKLILIII